MLKRKDPFGTENSPEQTTRSFSPQPGFLPDGPFSFSDISSFSSSGSSSTGSIPSPNHQADLSFPSFISDLDGQPSEDKLFELMCGMENTVASSAVNLGQQHSTSELFPPDGVFQGFHIDNLDALWNGTDFEPTGQSLSPVVFDSPAEVPSLAFSASSSSSSSSNALTSSSASSPPPPPPPSSSTSELLNSIFSTTRLDHTTLPPPPSPQTLAQLQPPSVFFETPVPQPQEVPSFILSYLSHPHDQTARLDHQSLQRPNPPSSVSHSPLEPNISPSAGTGEKRKAPPSPSTSRSSIPSSAVVGLERNPSALAAHPKDSPSVSLQSVNLPQPDQDGPIDGLSGPKQPTDHNAIERKYRDNINDGFTRLRDSVPVLRALFKTSTPITMSLDTPSVQTGLIDGMHPETKQGKATVLGAAREYIFELQRERARLKRYSIFLESRLGSSAWEDFLTADSHTVLDPYLQSITATTTTTNTPVRLPVRSQPISSLSLARSLPPPPPPPPRKKARVAAAVKPRRAAPPPTASTITTTTTTTTTATAATAGAVGGGTVMLVLGLGVGLFNPFDPAYSVDKNPGAGVVKGKVILGAQATPSSSLHSTPPPLSFAAPTCLCISIVVLSLMLLVVSRSARRRFQRGVSRWTKLVVRGTCTGLSDEDAECHGKQDRLPVGWVELEGDQVGGWVGWGWKAGERESHHLIGWGDRELILPRPVMASAQARTHTDSRTLAHPYLSAHPNVNHIYPTRPLPVSLPDPRISSISPSPPDPQISSLTQTSIVGFTPKHKDRRLAVESLEPSLINS